MNGGSVYITFKGIATDLMSKVNNAITDIKKGFAKLTDSSVVQGAKSFTDKVGGYFNTLALTTTALFTSALATVVDVMKQSVNEAAKLEQSIGGVETIFQDASDATKEFGKNSDKLIENAKKAYKTAGMSANEYMEQATSFGARLMQATGGDAAKAVELTDMALKDMSDNANKFGTDMASVEHAYQGFAKANYTMLDNLKLGYGGTKTEMQRLLDDAEKISGIHYDISNLGDVYNAIHVIQEELKVTGTTEKEAAQTITGSVNAAKAAWTNFLGGMGDFQSVVDSFMAAIRNIGNKLVEMTPQIISGIVSLITELSLQLPSIIMQVLPALIDGAVQLTVGLINALPTIINALAPALPVLIQAFIGGLAQIIQALAIQLPALIPMVVDALINCIPMFTENALLFAEAGIQLILGLTEGLIKGVLQLIVRIPDIFKKIIEGIKNYFGIHSPSTKMIEIGKMLLEGLKNGIVGKISNVVNTVKGIPGKILDKFKSGFSSIGSIGKNLLSGLTNGISNGVKSAVNAASSAAKSVLNKFKSIFGVHSPSTEFMWVGKMNMEGLNKGMEDMSPEIQKSIDGMFNLSPSMSGAVSNNLSPNVIVNATLNYEQDPLGQVVSNIKTFSGGAKNDYNYGMGGM